MMEHMKILYHLEAVCGLHCCPADIPRSHSFFGLPSDTTSDMSAGNKLHDIEVQQSLCASDTDAMPEKLSATNNTWQEVGLPCKYLRCAWKTLAEVHGTCIKVVWSAS